MTGAMSPAELASQGAEAIRTINRRLRGGALAYPCDAYDLIGNLRTLADQLPQLLGHRITFLEREHMLGHLGHESGRGAAGYVAAAVDALRRGCQDAEVLTVALDTAHDACSGLTATTGR